MWLASIRKPILEAKCWVHTVYTEMFPPKNTTSKPKYITASPKFIETGKVKKKKKKETGKLLLIKITREKSSKEQIVQQTFLVHYTLSSEKVVTKML